MDVKRLFFVFMLALVPMFSMADGRLSKEPLPEKISDFLSTHFSNVKVAFYKIERNILRIESYDVILTDGTDLEFDRRGNWLEIDGEKNALPLTVIQTPILSYIKERFPDNYVVSLDKKKNNKLEVQLNNGWELLFDEEFNIVNIDD